MKIEMDKAQTRNVIKALGGFSEHEIGNVNVDFLRGGIVLSAVDCKGVSMLIIAISKKHMKTYEIEDTTGRLLNQDTIEEIHEFCKVGLDSDGDKVKSTAKQNRYLKQQAKAKNKGKKKEEDQEQAVLIEPPEIDDNIILEIKDNDIHMTMGPLKRTVNNQVDETAENPKGVINTLNKMHNALDKIGEMKPEQFKELLNYMRAAYSFQGEEARSDRVVRLVKNEEKFEIETEIETGDDVIMDMDKALTKKTKEDLKVMLMSKTLYRGMKCIATLGTGIVLTGKTDHPLIISATGGSPEDAGKFQVPINFWYAIAPRIEDD